METKNLIQQSANVIRLTNLKIGDVYKRVDTQYSSTEIYYGVITDIMNDGENSFIEALEYTKSYSDVKATIKIFEGTKDVSIFPARIIDIKEYFDYAIKDLEKNIEKKKDELQKEITAYENAKLFVSGEKSKQLTEAEFEEMTQKDYITAKKIKEEKIKELTD